MSVYSRCSYAVCLSVQCCDRHMHKNHPPTQSLTHSLPRKMQSQICTDLTNSTIHVEQGHRSRTTTCGVGELVRFLDQGCRSLLDDIQNWHGKGRARAHWNWHSCCCAVRDRLDFNKVDTCTNQLTFQASTDQPCSATAARGASQV